MKNHFKSIITKGLLVAGGSLLLTAASSLATSITFSISDGVQPNDVGKITLTEINSTTVEVLLDLKNSTYGIMNSGGGHTPFTFSLSGSETGLSADFITPVGGIYPKGQFSLVTAGDFNPPPTSLGTFGIAINSTANNGSGNAFYGDLDFKLTRTGGLTAANFIANSNGYFFAADLTDGNNTGSQGWKTGVTVTTTDVGGVPDGGSTLMLLGMAFSGLGIARRFCGSKAKA